jgi:hypothetical protein
MIGGYRHGLGIVLNRSPKIANKMIGVVDGFRLRRMQPHGGSLYPACCNCSSLLMTPSETGSCRALNGQA